MQILIGCTIVVEYTGAQDAVTGAYLNSGTVTYSLQTVSGTVVASGSLAYEAASDGDYRGTIAAATTAGLTAGVRYILVLTFAQSSYGDVRRIGVDAAYRTT